MPAPAPRKELEDHHKAFSHVMYGLFLVSITFAAFYTFNALGSLGTFRNTEYFYPIVAIMMLLWSFLFWEFGHRVHTA
jgi:surface polysaccharide O-acyltransferase-like enzyme